MAGTPDRNARQPVSTPPGPSSSTPSPLIPPLPSTLNTREARRANAELTPVKPLAVTGRKARSAKAPKPPKAARPSKAPKPPKAAKPSKAPKPRNAPKPPKAAKPAKAPKPAPEQRNKKRPAKPTRSVRRRQRTPGRYDGSRTLTIVVASLAVISLIVVGALLWKKSQDPTVEQSMFAAYQSQQKELDGVATAAETDIEAFTALHEESTALNAAAATALAAVAGISDEPSRAAAETARVEFESSIAAQVVPAPDLDIPAADQKLSEESTVEELARGINGLDAEAQLLESEAEIASDALASLTTTRDTFAAALATFGATIPATATAVIAVNPDAAPALAGAVTSAVTGLTEAIEAGQPGVTELQAYAVAAAALQAEQARLDAIDTVEPDTDAETAPRATPRTTPRTPPRSTQPSNPPATTNPVTPAPDSPVPPVDPAPPVDTEPAA
ncbi:hypothetical protein D9V28_12110 [Mycetocola zhadangensis]|uniref:Uncharacterized protein n=1 Tax=Mycetocola zhadangensis TaxID=1164595 RepID=A0A3L7IYV3_9MICO|nr:hypothetical protein D9V28_12110 [Mycetocola zhadangensis]GGE99058.1 hypothetical protein GCM10011313_22520 [Mycetocola zhadangensis]